MTNEFADLLASDDLPDLPAAVTLASQAPVASPGDGLPLVSMAIVRPDNPAEFGFPASLPIELAAGLVSLQDLLDAYCMTLDQLRTLQKNELFNAEFERAMVIRKEPNGLVKLQSMIMLPKVLESQYLITQDKEMPPAVRVKAGENIMALPADLYPKKAADTGAVPQSISIVFNAPPEGFVPNVQRGVRTARIYNNDPDEN